VPWNFPLHLSLIPLTYIFAAGNRAMVKMSENSRHLAALLIEKMPAYFPPEKLRFFDETGGVGIEFSKLPFDHLLFTGSGQTGRSVMAAAATNLCPVTLELGGKAPAIVCDDFPLRVAAERILFAKLLNAGQICTTVDHAWLPRTKIEEFVALAREIVPARYPQLASTDYTSIIDERSFDRLVAALADARERGATVLPLLPEPFDPRDAQDRAAHRAERAGGFRADAARDLRADPSAAPVRLDRGRRAHRQRRRPAARDLSVQPRRRARADAARSRDVRRRLGQRGAVPRRAARPAVRRRRRLRHGPLPRPRGLRHLSRSCARCSTRRASRR
jgi:hypothetical protein